MWGTGSLIDKESREATRIALALQEDAAREAILESQRRWGEMWDESNAWGKLFLGLLAVGALLPLIFQVAFFFVLWLVIYPSVSSSWLHWAVISSILGLLLAIALQVRQIATKGAAMLYLMWGPSKHARRKGRR